MSECTCDSMSDEVSDSCPVHHGRAALDGVESGELHGSQSITEMVNRNLARQEREADSSRIVRALDELGLRDTQEARDILSVFVQCMNIYEERDKTRGGLWQRVGWKESLANARSKMTRVLMAREKPELVEMYFDDAYDLINFTVFFILNAHAGRSEWQA